MKKTPRTKCDFSLVLKVCREFDDVTSAGKLFHVGAAATGNARLSTVDSRVDGTSNAKFDDDRRHCRPGIIAFAELVFTTNNTNIISSCQLFSL